jgi:hypothetical protein
MDGKTGGGDRRGGRSFKLRLNVFDAVIIGAAVVVAVIFLRLGRAGGVEPLSSGKQITVYYMLELTNVPEGLASRIKPGDSVTEVVEKRAIGTVISVEEETYKVISKDTLTGEYFQTEVPERYTANVLIEASAQETDESIVVDGGFFVRNGLPVSARGPGYAGSGHIINVIREES